MTLEKVDGQPAGGSPEPGGSRPGGDDPATVRAETGIGHDREVAPQAASGAPACAFQTRAS